MSLYEKMESDMKAALKDGNTVTLSVLRMLVSAARKEQLDNNRKSIEDPDALRILQRHIKQHKESITQFGNGNRQDLVDKELVELKILEGYMPEQIGEEELKAIIKAAVAESGATGKAEMGKVMKLVMEKTKGCCDGKLVSQLVAGSLK